MAAFAGILRAAEGARRWRNPDSGFAIGGGLTLYHDAEGGEFAAVAGADAPLRLTIYQFHGSYVSLALALPGAGRARLGAGRRLEARLDVTSTRPLTVFLRLNFQAGDEVEPLYDTIVVERGERRVSFDLDALRVPFSAISSAWLDIIFSEPEMSEIAVIGAELGVVDRDAS